MDLQKIKELGTYEIIKEEALPDIGAEGILLRHRKTGARVALIPCADVNKVFAVSFRTPPTDSTGVAHIIEHTVLCGSEKFPLKDPFVELIKGSLNTFINAITYPDKTVYPVASTNDADFRNLMNVYLDAVFFPNIYHEQNIFRQEGWHYELESPDGELKLNGVVYNEMKGVFSSAEDTLEREQMNALFPDTSYGVESGGDPEAIPTLTYENYLDFHSRYYHPSNSFIYLYGDLDMADTLAFMDREYLSRFDHLTVDSAILRQAPFSEERVVTKSYAVSDEEEKDNTYLSYSVVAGDALDMKELTALDVLDYALLSAPGAPVKQALLDAGIGQDIYGGFSEGILQPYFSVTAKNANAEDAERFREVIRGTLEKQAADGVDRKALRAGLSSLEFSFREADYGSYPKGLFYGLDVLDTWLYDDGHPFDALKLLGVFKELGAEVETGYFEKLITEKLLMNPHAASVILVPEKGLQERREKALEEKLAAMKAGLDEAGIARLIEETKALRDWQDAPESEEALASLPVLTRADIRKHVLPRSNEEGSVLITSAAGTEHAVPVVYHDAETNGIGYLQLLFNVKRVKTEDLPYLGLLRAALTGMRTASYTYNELSNEIHSETGGISVTLRTADRFGDEDAYLALLDVRMKALTDRIENGAALLREILFTTDFTDDKRLREIVAQSRSHLQMTLQQSGHAAALTRAAAYKYSDAAFNDAVSGIAYYRFLKDLEEHYEERKDALIEKLKETAAAVIRPDNVIASFTCLKAERSCLAGVLTAIFEGAPAHAPLADESEPAPYGKKNEGFTTPGQVQYVAICGSYVKAGIPFVGAMAVYRQVMTYEYLWQNVRVRGGAYDCGASMGRNGRGSMTSYRDPHLARTKQVFADAPAFLRAFDADEEEMTKYVIGTISALDTPLTPASFGMASMNDYLAGYTDGQRQKFRDEVLQTSAEDIRKLADSTQAVLDTDCFCVIGGESAIEKDRELFGSVEVLL